MSRLIAGLVFGLLAIAAQADGLLSPATHRSFLPPDQAFVLGDAEAVPGGIRLHWDIAPGYYLYRDKIFVEDADKTALKLELPAAERFTDPAQGDSWIYRGALSTLVKPGAKGKSPSHLHLRYQGCAEAGLCYPPQDKEIDVSEGGGS